MRRITPLVCIVVLVALLSLLVQSTVRAASPGPDLVEFFYSWGSEKIGGARVWTTASTNVTRDVTVVAANGSSSEEITEFRIFVRNPGGDSYPSTNGTNPSPYPMLSALYDTTRILRNPNDCVWVNDTQGLVCNVPRVDWTHQVLEIRFVRLFEFQDANGNGAYDASEPLVSQVNLSDARMVYSMPEVRGLHASGGLLDLPVRGYVNDTCCQEDWMGWIGRDSSTFADYSGLRFRMSATGAVNLTITGSEWFQPREFHGVNLTASQVKLDLHIANYPFGGTGTRLAFDVNLTSFSQGSATQWNTVPWPEGQGLSMDARNTTALFAWSSDAIADGRLVSVVSSQASVDAFSRHVLLAYPTAASIDHDPVFGIHDKRVTGSPGVVGPPTGVLSPAVIAFVGTLGAGSVVLYLVERRKK